MKAGRRGALFLLTVFGLSACGGGSPSNPVQESEPEPEQGPDFDFSGDIIAFMSDRDGNQEIYLMTADGSQVLNITNNFAADGDPAWSPDGTKIAFSSVRAGNSEI